MSSTSDVKRAMRSEMRVRRVGLSDPHASARIARELMEVVDPDRSRRVMVFAAVPGEPDLRAFVAWCADRGIETVAPSPTRDAMDPIEAEKLDLVVVPGLAFSADGHRLGQGGGWYDRFLARTRADCTKVGVCFAGQVVPQVPIEPHDVPLDLVVTDTGTIGGGSTSRR